MSTTNPVVSRVSMLILMQHDLEAAVKFYQNLGIKLRFHMKNQWAEFELNGVKIGLCPISEKLPRRRTGIVLEVEDLDQVYNQFKDSIEFMSEPVEKVHGKMVGIVDPGENVIDLYQPTPEKIQEVLKKAAEEEGCCKQEKEQEVSGCCKSKKQQA